MNTLPKSIVLAPVPTNVFAVPLHDSKYLFPLLSFELSEVFNDLSGQIHFIDPIEPYDGCIGGFTEEYHSYYCRENWVSFIVKDGLYAFDASENYFAKAYWETHEVPERVHESVRTSWKQAVDNFYLERTTKYKKWCQNLRANKDENIRMLNIEFAGKPCFANWVHLTDFPLSVDYEDVAGQSFPDTFHYPLTEDGRRFRYIGSTESFDWRCVIHLFFDPVEQRALQTFDWT